MASKLLNVLKSIERGRQACINTMKEKNLIIQNNSSFDEIAGALRDIEVYDNAKSTIPHYYDNPEDDPIVYKVPTDWPDIETILKSQTEDLIQTDYYNVPIRIALLNNTQPTITFSMTTSNNISATDDIIYVAKQDSSSNSANISYCSGATIITSDGAEYNIGKYYGVDSIQHTWDSTKDIDNKYRWFVIKRIMHAYTSGDPPRQGYIHGMSANTTPLLAIIEAPGFCYGDQYAQMYGRYSNSLLFIKTISPFTPVHINIANAVATYRRNNTTQNFWKQIPLMAHNYYKMVSVKRFECDVSINKDQYILPNPNSDNYVNLEVFICNAELSNINKNSIRKRYFNESNLIYFKTALSPQNAYGLSDLFDSQSNSNNTIRAYMPLRYFEISNLEQYIAEQSCLRCRGLAGLADLKPEHKQKLLNNLEILSNTYYGNYFDESFLHDKQVNINLHTGNIPPAQSGSNTFYNCNIDHLTIHNLVTVENNTFNYATIRSITLPDCVIYKPSITYGTFYVDLPNCTELSVTSLVSSLSTIRIINMPKYRVTDQNFFIKNNMLEDVVVGSIYCDVNLSESIFLKPECLAHIFDALETLLNDEGYTITIPAHLHNYMTQENVQSAEAKGWKVVY